MLDFSLRYADSMLSVRCRRKCFPMRAVQLVAALLLGPAAGAQIISAPPPSSTSLQKPAETAVPARGAGVGDTPDQAPPLATDLSTALGQWAIDKAMRSVGDWQLQRAQPYFSQDWTFAALYTGFMAASDSLPEPAYRAAMIDVGKKFKWTLGPRLIHADDQAIGQTYLELYLKMKQPQMIEATQAQFDHLMSMPDDPVKPVWWWCDALFMAPDVWAQLSKATGDTAYLDYMDREWWITSRLLYDPKQQLYFRDATYLDKKEKNGAPIFWSRGNGWVLAGLARVLEDMPEEYPSRPRYVEQFQQMAKRIALLQGRDGLWRPGLLDPEAYPLPENSGSAFFVYAMAWGINHGLLDAPTYMPVVQKGWAGLIQHVYADGRLGCIQPIGAAPGDYKAASSYVYGVGAFLLAGSELKRLDPKLLELKALRR